MDLLLYCRRHRILPIFDYEVEPVIVMGKEAKNVSEPDALSYVAGYCTGNDFTARDLQLETPSKQWTIGKIPDQFAPLGQNLVTSDKIDPDNLKIECRVNGETRQSSQHGRFDLNRRQIISLISRYMTLKPGDIIFTGTPEGVIAGRTQEKQVWLKPGDKVACSLEKLGELKFDLEISDPTDTISLDNLRNDHIGLPANILVTG